jgi:hypothetical protein
MLVLKLSWHPFEKILWGFTALTHDPEYGSCKITGCDRLPPLRANRIEEEKGALA